MPAYAGFQTLGDYLKARCHEHDTSLRQASKDLGHSVAYLHSLCSGRHRPGRAMADAIADYFGDERRIVRILADLDEAPHELGATLSAIMDMATKLPPARQKELLDFASYLHQKGK